MKKTLLTAFLLISIKVSANDVTKCDLSYSGDSNNFHGEEYSFMGISTGNYLYTCSDCDGIQISVYPAENADRIYDFKSNFDFLRKSQPKFNKRDIANLELSALSQQGKIKFVIDSVDIADFFPLGEKISYITFSARQEKPSRDINYIGFISSTGVQSCSIVASYEGNVLGDEGRKALSYFMNNVSF